MKRKPKDLADAKAIEIITEALLVYVAEAQKHSLDPFEEYVFGVQSKVFSEKMEFQNRCLHGYQVLLQALS